MPWTERQHAMLREMGHVVWTPPAARGDGPVPRPAAAVEPLQAAPRVATAAALPSPRPQWQPQPQPQEPQPLENADAYGAVASMDWQTLRTTVAACRACGLCESRTQTVFGIGHPQAHWMVVGEAPGEQEDRLGEPFVGTAGQLLDRMLAALQLKRSSDGPEPAAQRVYIANALKCRPPRNRNPSAEEMARCEPYLVRQIALLQPRLILAMGKFAAQALLHSDEPVGRLRGRVHRCQGLPLVVTYHPAYLLRTPADKARAWDDLCLAAGVAQARSDPVSAA